jgi:general secretion pathway protein L
MLALIPEALRVRAAAWPDALIVCWLPPGHFALVRRYNRRERELGKFALDPAGLAAGRAVLLRRRSNTVVLRLAADMVLERPITLPLAAERDLRRVLGYEMDRLTPFAAEEVFWAAAVESRDRAAGRLVLRLSVVPKAGLWTLLQALEEIGLSPSVIETDVPQMAARRIPLRETGSRSERRWRLALASTASVCAALAVAAVVLPFARQSLALMAVQQRIDELQPRVDEVQALRRRIAAASAGTDAIAAESARLGEPLQALAALTDILPDDTYLTELRLHQRKLTINGQSLAAARLIAGLAADPLIRNPAFVAPVTRAEAKKGDLFSIRAEIGP